MNEVCECNECQRLVSTACAIRMADAADGSELWICGKCDDELRTDAELQDAEDLTESTSSRIREINILYAER